MPPRGSPLESLPSFLPLDSARPAPALQNRAQRGAEAAYSASVSFEGGGVKIPRKRTTRRSGVAIRDSVARLVSVAVMVV